jgi:hypothetical protein
MKSHSQKRDAAETIDVEALARVVAIGEGITEHPAHVRCHSFIYLGHPAPFPPAATPHHTNDVKDSWQQADQAIHRSGPVDHMHTYSAQVCHVFVLVSPLGHPSVAHLPHLTYQCSSALYHAERTATAGGSPAVWGWWR